MDSYYFVLKELQSILGLSIFLGLVSFFLLTMLKGDYLFSYMAVTLVCHMLDHLASPKQFSQTKFFLFFLLNRSCFQFLKHQSEIPKLSFVISIKHFHFNTGKNRLRG